MSEIPPSEHRSSRDSSRNSSASNSSVPNSSNSARISLAIIIIALIVGVVVWKRRPHNNTAINSGQITTLRKLPPGMVLYTIYVPDDQALLTQKILAEKNPYPKKPTWEMKAGRTLELLFTKLKDLPSGTKILLVPKREKNGVVRINLSREFSRIQAKPDTVVALVLDAMASTLGAVDVGGKTLNGGKAMKLRILIENQPVHEFSEFDLSTPWTSTQPQEEIAPPSKEAP